jgi:hypothetical protein
MKTLLMSILLFFVTQVSHAYVQFEVQPLSLKAQSQVMGVHTGEQGQDAIIYTGQAAQKVAKAAGCRFNPAQEMIVATGSEVTSLVVGALGVAYNTGTLALITSAVFAKAGLRLALNTIRTAAGFTFLTVSTAASLGKTIVHYAIEGAAYSAYVASNIGLQLVKAPLYILGVTLKFACLIPDYFGIGFIDCE